MNDPKFKKQAAEMVEALTEAAGNILPRHPRCLVWITPRSGQILDDSGKVLLYTPEKQSKPMYEGMILRTYEPFWRQFRNHATAQVYVKSDLSPGDHVLFSHYAGLDGNDGCQVDMPDAKGQFRLIPEDKLVATLEYRGPNSRAKNRLRRMVGKLLNEVEVLPKDAAAPFTAVDLANKFVKDLMETAEVLFHLESKTISGR